MENTVNIKNLITSMSSFETEKAVSLFGSVEKFAEVYIRSYELSADDFVSVSEFLEIEEHLQDGYLIV
ncbi:hypothetical protein EXD82_03895 [Peptacetobacter hominis]|uniref:Uncharacterized protein n=1 Tax=Peptacetobacter hominis TaxID=2743610 RepID=A0A544QWC6_9FIRM|nr:hypothetical protein [Peptacetobacter hominis]TQQ84995.1 hypothetical protein EXD82_03895 [Peptacetobacter hominis]